VQRRVLAARHRYVPVAGDRRAVNEAAVVELLKITKSVRTTTYIRLALFFVDDVVMWMMMM
jgi:hypothetical protein